MKTFLKLCGVALLGAALYLFLTSEDEEGFAHEVKALVNEVVAEGKKAAEQRRVELESELGFRANGSQAA